MGGDLTASPAGKMRTSRRAFSVAIVAATLVVVGCGPSAAAPLAPDTIPLTVHTPHAGFNRLSVSVTLCVPGTRQCTTIDDVMVDTGSTGLRIEAAALPASFHLPPFLGIEGAPIAECLRFVHAAAWGPLVRADLHLGGLVAPNIAMQVIADGPSAQPPACPSSQVQATSNGTLGVAPRLTDCPGSCKQVASAPGVFAMKQGAWVPLSGAVPVNDRVPNPVTRLPGHDNGVVIDLPAPRGGGEAAVTGALTLGVGTGPDGLADARIVPLDTRGYFTTLYGDQAYPESYLDSGTMTDIVPDDRLPRCERASWAFCVRPRRTLAATIVGSDGARTPAPFAIGDYDAAREHNDGAADDLAVAGDPGTKTFVWGAPFFLGRRIVIVIEGKGVPGRPDVGPFFAIRTKP